MDRRKTNKVGCKGYDIDNKTIVSLYLSGGLTMKEIGTKLDISHWTVLDRLKKSGVKKNTRHKVNHSVFSKPNVKNCYWAGFLAADGCVVSKKTQVEVELQYKDKAHLEKLCSFAGRDTKLWVRERCRDDKIFKYASVSLVSKQIVKDLNRHFNIIPNKSLVLSAPDIPNRLNKHFVRGYIDGDGSIGWHKHNNKPRLHIVSGSKDILKWIKDVIAKEVDNIGNPSIMYPKNKEVAEIEYMGFQVYNILDWLYFDSTKDTRLQRKYERYEKYSKTR